VILVDTSGLLPAYHRGDKHRSEVQQIIERSSKRILSPFVLTEMDYMVTRYGGTRAEAALLDDVARGAYELVPFTAADVALAHEVIVRYADLELGLADASIVVLAHRFNCRSLLTLDKRHFRALHGPLGQPFHILPADKDE